MKLNHVYTGGVANVHEDIALIWTRKKLLKNHVQSSV